MMPAFAGAGEAETAVFAVFVRKLPPGRNFLESAGLDHCLDLLEDLQMRAGELAWLAASGHFSAAFLDGLRDFRFTDDVHAMPDGTIFLPDEPILLVTAPLPQAHYVETRLINLPRVQTPIASRAARAAGLAPLPQSQGIRIRATRHRTRLQIWRAASGRSEKTYSNK